MGEGDHSRVVRIRGGRDSSGGPRCVQGGLEHVGGGGAVHDLGAAGALAGLAGAFNMESSTESDGKYEKMGKVDGRLTKEAYEADGSYALDQLISTFSQVPMEEAMDPKKREERRQHLLEKLDKHYKGDVMDVYFTEFVTQ